MNVLILDATTKLIEAHLEAAPTGDYPCFTSHFATLDSAGLAEGEEDGQIDDSTVTLVSAPAASQRRVVREITIYNADSVAHNVTLLYHHGMNERVLRVIPLDPGEAWCLSEALPDTIASEADVAAAVAAHNASTNVHGLKPTIFEALNGATLPSGSNPFATLADIQTRAVCRVLLNQSSEADPVATVLENTLPGAVAWSRGKPGFYYGTLAGAFPADKTFLLASTNCEDGAAFLSLTREADDVIRLVAYDFFGEPGDGLLINTPVEIDVYP